MSKTIKKALPYSAPVIVGYILLSITYGIMISQIGLAAWMAPFISATVYAGSLQFVLIPFLATGAPIITIILLTLSVNIRMMFYGLPLLRVFKNSRSKFLFTLTLTDEAFAIYTTVDAPADVNEADFYLAIGVINYLVWILGSYVGALMGQAISFNTTGLDFILTALFIVLTLEQYKATTNHKPFALGLTISILALLLFEPNNFMIPALFLIVLSLLGLKSRIEAVND